MLEHKKRIDEIVKGNYETRKKEREQRMTSFQRSYDISKYHTKFTENVLDEEANRVDEREKREEER